MKAEWSEEDDRKLEEQIRAVAISSDAILRAREKKDSTDCDEHSK